MNKSVFGLVFISSVAFGETTIYLSDGTSITTEDNVYVSSEPLYAVSGTLSETLIVTPVLPLEASVEPPVASEEPEEPVLFEHGYNGTCASYVAQGPSTFDGMYEDQRWSETCDSNGDGVYNFCEDYIPYQEVFTFTDIDYKWACEEN